MTLEHPQISVIIPAYNVRPWIEQAIASLLAQTFQDFEIIVVDDGSTDGTRQWLQTAAQHTPRLRVFFNPHNLKIARTLNVALSHARGTYIARMDADDVAEPERLQKQLAWLHAHPDCALVGSQMTSIDEQGRHLGQSNGPVSTAQAARVVALSSPVPHIWLCKKALYDQLGGYREMPGVEDYDFLLRMHSLGLRFCNHPDALMRIRLRAGNTASTSALRQRKAQNYVLGLYRERAMHGGADSFSEQAWQAALRANGLTHWLHSRSSRWLASAIGAAGLRRFMLVAGAALLSPYNAQYLARRIAFRLVLRRQA